MARVGETISFPFEPRPYQVPSFKARANGMKRGLCIWPRRHGKDLHFLTLMAGEALKRKGLYNYYWPTFSLGKKTIWKGMDREGKPFIDYIPKDLVADKNETELRLELSNGSIIQIIGTDNINQNVVGINPVGCGFSEYPLQNPMAWELTRPILKENGGWAWFLYTPRGRNHGYRLYQSALENPDTWFVSHLNILQTSRADGTPIMTPADVESEIKEGMDPDLAQQEYYCLHPSTRVLTADLRWVPLVDVREGDDLIGVDEHGAANTNRKFRRSTITKKWFTTKPCKRIVFENGTEVIASDEHPWLEKRRPVKRQHATYVWTETKDLQVGMKIAQVGLRPWETDNSRDGGWLAGMYEGEGCLSRTSLSVAQNPGRVLDQLETVLQDKGAKVFRTQSKKCVSLHASLHDAMTLLGSLRPVRLLEKSAAIWENRYAMSGIPPVTIRSIQDAGVQPVVGISSSTQTFIAEGLVTHNCSFDAPMQGSYYGRLLSDAFKQDRVGFYPYNPAFQVISGWDIGTEDPTTIWYAQLIGEEIRLIDYYEAVGEDFYHYFKHTMDQPWRNSEVHVPFDIEKTDWGTGKSACEIAVKAFSAVGVRVNVVAKLDVQEKIGVCRRLFPRMTFHDKTVGKVKYRGHSGTDTLASYHKKFNEDKQEYERKPHHNWASHGANALETLCLGIKDLKPRKVEGFYTTAFDPMKDIQEGQYESFFETEPEGAAVADCG